MTDNPYAAPVSTTGIIAERNDFKDVPTDRLKKLRNDSHSIRTMAVLILIGVVISGIGFIAVATSMGSAELAVVAMLGCMVLLNLVTAIGFITRPKWARILGIVVAALMLLGFPIGTLIGILLLVALTRSKELFGPGRYPHKALNAEWKYRKQNKVA